ncbi:MAG: hypothetical protein H6710_05460 [Myxococcales bacterium]|nr:hypothetical protein [Myxococcales bacterium]
MLRRATIGLLAPCLALGAISCRSGGDAITQRPPDRSGDPNATSQTSDPQTPTPPVEPRFDFDLALEPHEGPWTPLAVVDVRPLTPAEDLAPTRVATWRDEMSVAPFPNDPLPGRAIGLLWSVAWWSGGPPNCTDAPPEERVEYHFSRGHDSHYALYFPSDGRGFNYLTGWSVELPLSAGGGRFHGDAAMFRADTPNPWGLGACAHLVEVEVNGGRGGQSIHFIATALRQVEGTDAFAGNAQEVLEALIERLLGALAGEHARVDQAIAAQRGEARERGSDLSGLPRTLDELPPAAPMVIATWLPEPGELDVRVRLRREASASRVVGREVIRDTNSCPPGAPCAHREQGTFETVATATLRVTVGARYRVDRRARLVSETFYAPQVEILHANNRRRVR